MQLCHILVFIVMLGMFPFCAQSNSSPKDRYYWPVFTDKESELGQQVIKIRLHVQCPFLHHTYKQLLLNVWQNIRLEANEDQCSTYLGFSWGPFPELLITSLFGHLFNDILSDGDTNMYPTVLLSRYESAFTL